MPGFASWLRLVLLAAASSLALHAEPPEQEVLATVQATFDAMAKHDAAALAKILDPDGSIAVVREDGKITRVTNQAFIGRIANAQGELLERIWNPKIQVDGGLATLWAPFDFHLNGQFTHCGTDAITLVRDSSGWKITHIAYTHKSSNCEKNPAGPPAARP